jgi:hypothetical protein
VTIHDVLSHSFGKDYAYNFTFGLFINFLWVAGTAKLINCFLNVLEGSYDNEGIWVPKPFTGKHLSALCCSCLSIKATLTKKNKNWWMFSLFSVPVHFT